MQMPKLLESRVGIRGFCAGVALQGMLSAGLTSCLGTPRTSTACMPPDYSVAPNSAARGETVRVTAPEATCNPRYGQDAQVEITVTEAHGKDVIHLIVPMEDTGKFSSTFVVPSGTSAGDASVVAVPYGVDWCDDTGRNNRVAGALQVVRTSCVLPSEPLGIAD
ncbi:hypothetical protein [Glutamicibacter sp.]|jgi:hypothetical protein|uniref:hypothetical protein n=2 Tax=Glutamicibacter sp. TaxID=1931995 RepID=UPI002B466673|nr:hypothetical protein [Glutamicibacter sp.]HJX76900.1 hypothetical protein [Glutamicibacter sp.]